LRATLMQFHPWRKGPLQLGGVLVDTEWRSDRKWDRLAGQVDFKGCTELDVGSGNGSFGWRMLGAGALFVVGIDPTLVFVMQWLAHRHFSGEQPIYVLPLADTDLPELPGGFDRVVSMGVLYHRKDPADHLQKLAACLRPGGQLVLETLVLDQAGEACLQPPGRYARMRNVHSIPSPSLLLRWLAVQGFRAARILDVSATSLEEQRSTAWMHFESLDRCLDPQDPQRTVEGHPAPVRALVSAVAAK
jgi:tRNA (mo5U34)-methyltransferase